MLSHLRAESALWFVSCGIFLLSALPLFGRVDLGGVLVKGLSARMVMWLAAIRGNLGEALEDCLGSSGRPAAYLTLAKACLADGNRSS